MPSYVAFLRAINLGAKRKFGKTEIVAATETAGATAVATYINTGNVRLTTALRSRAKVETALESAYLDRAGFDVPTITFTCAELVAIADAARALTASRSDLERHYLHLLKQVPDPDRVAALEALSDDMNAVVVRDRVAHLLLGPGYQAGAPDPFKVEKTLGVLATSRNFNVITTLADRWC